MHRGKPSAVLCGRGCGRGTFSFTGFCSHCGGARVNAQIKASKLRRGMDALASWLVENWEPPASPEPLPDPQGDAPAAQGN